MDTQEKSSAEVLRQVALMIDSLDCATADMLLERLPANQERIVRDHLMELREVGAHEQDAATGSFLRNLLCELDEPAPTGSDFAGTGGLTAGVAAAAGAVGAIGAIAHHGREAFDGNFEDDSVASQLRQRSDEDDGYLAHAGEPGSHAAMHCDTMPCDAVAQEDVDEFVESGSLGQPSGAASDAAMEHIPTSVLPLRDVIEFESIDSLARVLKHEQPQTVALVMAAMLPEEAAEFISYWPQMEQGEVLRRIAKLDSVDEGFVQAVRSELLIELERVADETAKGEQGRERVQAIVAAAQGSVRNDLLGGLADADRELFRQVAMAAGQGAANEEQPDEFDPHLAAVAFDRFVDLSDEGLKAVFHDLDADVAVLALAGASQPCLTDVLDRLPKETSDDLRGRMERLGPLRLGDIQQAQLMAVAASHHLLSGSSARMAPRLKLSA